MRTPSQPFSTLGAVCYGPSIGGCMCDAACPQRLVVQLRVCRLVVLYVCCVSCGALSLAHALSQLAAAHLPPPLRPMVSPMLHRFLRTQRHSASRRLVHSMWR